MKPCWYIDSVGAKCRNEGIKVSVIEDLVIAEITKYKYTFVSDMPDTEDDELEKINSQIDDCESILRKQVQALEVVNDAYEYGDYTRTDWLKRKKKWEDEIHKTKNSLYELHKQAKSTVRITNADRQKMLSDFFDNITQLTDQATRNTLYQTVLKSIIWRRCGDDIKVSIKFK
jgi:site-specific DNA recombinase